MKIKDLSRFTLTFNKLPAVYKLWQLNTAVLVIIVSALFRMDKNW